MATQLKLVEKEKDVRSIVDMLEELENNRWNEQSEEIMNNPFKVVANSMGYEKRQESIASLSDFANYSWGIKEEFDNDTSDTKVLFMTEEE